MCILQSLSLTPFWYSIKKWEPKKKNESQSGILLVPARMEVLHSIQHLSLKLKVLTLIIK